MMLFIECYIYTTVIDLKPCEYFVIIVLMVYLGFSACLLKIFTSPVQYIHYYGYLRSHCLWAWEMGLTDVIETTNRLNTG